MRSADECRSKAAEMRRLSLEAACPEATRQYLLMARDWGDLAQRAERQDRPSSTA